MSKLLTEKVEQGHLLEIVSSSIEEIVEEAVSLYGLNHKDLIAYTCGDTKKTQTTVFYKKSVIFKVTHSAEAGLGYFLWMTKDQAREALADCFLMEGEVA